MHFRASDICDYNCSIASMIHHEEGSGIQISNPEHGVPIRRAVAHNQRYHGCLHLACDTAGLLNRLLPDVWVHTDHHSGRTGGESPGFALSLVAESTTGVLLVAETAAEKVR